MSTCRTSRGACRPRWTRSETWCASWAAQSLALEPRKEFQHRLRTVFAGATSGILDLACAQHADERHLPPGGAFPWLWRTARPHQKVLARLMSSLYVLSGVLSIRSSKRALHGGPDCHHREDQPGERHPRRCWFSLRSGVNEAT